MAVTDTIADFLTRIRNAQMAEHRIVSVPSSKMRRAITEILYDQGFIHKYRFTDEGHQGMINIALKYNRQTKSPTIKKIGRISKPGYRQYVPASDIPRIINGLGVVIVSTSKGVMTGKQAKQQNVGGELVCYLY